MLQETVLRLAGSRPRRAGDRLQRGAPLPGGRAAAAAAHRAARDRARALRPQHRAGDRARGARGAQGARRARRTADPMLLVLPADHVIRDIPAFHARRARGAAAARRRQAGHLRHRRRPRPRPATATSSAARRAAAAFPHRALRREARATSARASSSPPATTTGTAACSCSARAATWRSSSASRRRWRGVCEAALPGREGGPGLHAHRRARSSRPAQPTRSTTRSWRRPPTRWWCR